MSFCKSHPFQIFDLKFSSLTFKKLHSRVMVIVCTWNLYLSMLNVKLAAINPLGKLEGWAAWISHFVNYILCNNKGKIRKCTFSCFSVYFSTRIYFFLSNDKSLMHFFTQKKLPKKRKLGELMSNIGRHFFNMDTIS